MKVYLDNAATTALDPEVCDAMVPVLKEKFGNPSSVHSYGREAKTLIENSRKQVADILNCSPGEIFFTSGGTEADNMAIRCSVLDFGIKKAITSRLEHHAVLHTLEDFHAKGQIDLKFIDHDHKGRIDLDHLDGMLKDHGKTFVSLMHANNEIGNLIDLNTAAEICNEHNAVFHSDTVQTVGHYEHNLQETKLDFLACAAHKFHGPKGIGFIYINSDTKVNPMITGGSQERNMRGGTENVYGIVGLAKALEITARDLEKDSSYILSLKNYMMEQLVNTIPGIEFNGDPSGNSLYTVLNACFPKNEGAEMLLFNLDIAGIACSGGSACSSGSDQGSHVLKALERDSSRPSVRFSFSKYNKKEDIDFCISQLKELFPEKVS